GNRQTENAGSLDRDVGHGVHTPMDWFLRLAYQNLSVIAPHTPINLPSGSRYVFVRRMQAKVTKK
ncbi:MAG: hypothetical protein AAF965_15465, partial [Pseudomonadota bacterium]